MRNINHMAVWAAAITHFAIGAVWYSVLQQPWLAGIGKTMAELTRDNGGSPLPYVIGFATILVMAYVMAWILQRLDARTIGAGAQVGAALGLGLVAMQLGLNYAFEWRALSLWLVNGGYAVLGLAVMGGIIGGWHRSRSQAADTRA